MQVYTILLSSFLQPNQGGIHLIIRNNKYLTYKGTFHFSFFQA